MMSFLLNWITALVLVPRPMIHPFRVFGGLTIRGSQAEPSMPTSMPWRRGKLRPEAPQPLSLLLILVWITTMSILQATYGSIRAKLPAMALMMMAMASLMIFTVTISLTMMRIQSPTVSRAKSMELT